MNRQKSVFQIVGVLLFTPLSFLGQLLNQFLLSPWGLVVPLTLLIALVALHHVQKTPDQLALFYAEQLETCDIVEVPRLLKTLVQMEDAGVPGLVKGLTSNREAVFAASLFVLQREFDRWQESERREHHFRVFSAALLHVCDQFSPAAQAEAVRFADRMMQVRSVDASPDATADRQKTVAQCGQILERLESMRRRRVEPTAPEFAAPNDTVASLNRRTQQPVLLASNGRPFVPTSTRENSGIAVAANSQNADNPFSAPRAERLLAYQRTQQNRPVENQSNPRLSEDGELSWLANFAPPAPFAAEIAKHIAQNYTAAPQTHLPAELEPQPPFDISEEYRNQRRSESNGESGSGESGMDNFLAPELRSTPLDRVPNLPTTQLMKLLHHSDTAYVESARRTLASRDGFQETHLRLAWRLYHPIPAVRQEIVAMLPSTANVQPMVWLTVLLNDPSNDVRFRAASFLATASDPALQRLLIDRGRRDTDARIVNLATQIDESQRTIRR